METKKKGYLLMGRTSTAVKNRYIKRVYKLVAVRVERDTVEAWEAAIKEDGITKAGFIRDVLEAYLKDRAKKS
jgi:hypothetical protein